MLMKNDLLALRGVLFPDSAPYADLVYFHRELVKERNKAKAEEG